MQQTETEWRAGGNIEELKYVGGRHVTGLRCGAATATSSTSHMKRDKHILHKSGHAREERNRKY